MLPAAAFGIMTSSIFQAIGHGFISLWGSLLRQLVGILPMAWIFSWIAGLELVWYSFPLAELIGYGIFRDSAEIRVQKGR